MSAGYNFSGATRDAVPASVEMSPGLPRLTIVVLMAIPVVPGALNKVGGGATQQAANAAAVMTPLAKVAQLGLGAAFVFACSLLLLRSAPRLWDRDALPILFLGLGIWAYMAVRVYIAGQEMSSLIVIFPALLLAFWLYRPSVYVLGTVGLAGSATAALALVMGVSWPEVGLYVNETGELSVSDKGLISGNLLAGPFTSTNNLGQFVALTVPFLFFLRGRLLRLASLLPSIACIVWSGSRSSVLALAIGGAVALVLRGRVLTGRSWAVVYLGAIVCLLLPVVARSAPDSFSGRGNLWRVSLESWAGTDWFFGLGDKWYSELAGRRTGLGDRADFLAFHGHNQFVHILVTAGVFGLACFAIWLWLCVRSFASLPGPEASVMFTWVSMFLVSGAFELNLDPFDRVQFFGQSLVPLLVAGLYARGYEARRT